MAQMPPPKSKSQQRRVDSTLPTAEEELAKLYKDVFIPTNKFFVAPGRKNHLLEHYMPGPGSVTAIISPPGGGKTTLLAYLAFTYAFKLRYNAKQTGADEITTEYGNFLGLRMTQRPGPVLVIAREGHRQLQLLGAHENEILSPASIADSDYYEPIIVMSENQYLKLDVKPSVDRLHAMLAAFELKHKRPPGLIILDTARKLLAGDENSSSDVSSFMQACQHIAKECKAAVVIAHHTPKKGETARGSGAWLADTDCEWVLSPNKKEKSVKVSVTKLKGFPLPDAFHFAIKSVDTGLPDADNPGKFLSAAHIELCAGPKDSSGEASAKNLVRTPEQKHAKRQAERLDMLVCVWEDYCAKDLRNERPYITRSALAEYLRNVMGYSDKTAQQAMKPAADPNKANSIIGPLLTDNLIAPIEHGWIILPPPGSAQDEQPKRKVARRKP